MRHFWPPYLFPGNYLNSQNIIYDPGPSLPNFGRFKQATGLPSALRASVMPVAFAFLIVPCSVETGRINERDKEVPQDRKLNCQQKAPCFLGEPVPSSSQGIAAQLCWHFLALLPRRRRLPSPKAGGAGVTRQVSKGKWAAKAAI